MTGFGRGSARAGATEATVEVRSVNGRHAEVQVRAPRTLAEHEAALVARVKEALERGHATVHVSLERAGGAGAGTVNAAAARAWAATLRALRDAAGLSADEAPVTLADLLRQPDVLASADDADARDEAGEATQAALADALARLDAMRVAEGAALADDLAARTDALEALLAQVEARAPERVDEARARLAERLAALFTDDRLDPARLEAEVALVADRLDVTEECVRLRSHLAQVREALAAGGAVGRRLTFLAQEVGREVNTIGSKANDAEVARLAVAMKDELEKVREQVQNVV